MQVHHPLSLDTKSQEKANFPTQEPQIRPRIEPGPLVLQSYLFCHRLSQKPRYRQPSNIFMHKPVWHLTRQPRNWRGHSPTITVGGLLIKFVIYQVGIAIRSFKIHERKCFKCANCNFYRRARIIKWQYQVGCKARLTSKNWTSEPVIGLQLSFYL